jgi:hypothetical protein
MTIAFLAWGLSAICLFVAIRSQIPTLLGRIGLVLLLIGTGPILAPLPHRPITTPLDAITTSGFIHSLGAMLGDGILIGGTLITLSLVRRNPNWSPVRTPLILGSWLHGLGYPVHSLHGRSAASQRRPARPERLDRLAGRFQ